MYPSPPYFCIVQNYMYLSHIKSNVSYPEAAFAKIKLVCKCNQGKHINSLYYLLYEAHLDTGGRLNKKDGLTRYGNYHVKDKTS